MEEHIATGAPVPQKPNSNQRILDEESYISTLEHIISRDYFPDLHAIQNPTELQKQSDIPTENNINQNIHSSKSFHDLETPSMVQSSTDESISDMAMVHYVNGETLSKIEHKTIRNMSLAQFQDRYTSEDNYSVSEILFKNGLEHYQRYPWIYEQQQMADNRKKYIQSLKYDENVHGMENDSKKTLAIEYHSKTIDIEKFRAMMDREVIKVNEKNGRVQFRSDMKLTQNINDKQLERQTANALRIEQEKEMREKKEIFDGELEFWDFQSINKLLFPLTFDEKTKESNLRAIQKIYLQFGKPELIPENTRLPKNFKHIKSLKIQSKEKMEMNDKLRGYSMVRTPIIKPGHSMMLETESLHSDSSQLTNNEILSGTPIMTYGTIAQTPVIIHCNSSSSNIPSFHIPRLPAKDIINHTLNKKNTLKLRKKQEQKLRVFDISPHSKMVHTPKSILLPSGNRLETSSPMIVDQSHSILHTRMHRHRSHAHRHRTIEQLSPAARKLMQMRMHGNLTPLTSSMIGRKRKLRTESQKITPAVLCHSNRSVGRGMKRKKSNDGFAVPIHSLTQNRYSKKNNRKINHKPLSTITDGLL